MWHFIKKSPSSHAYYRLYTPTEGAFPDLLLPHAAFMHIWLKLQITGSEYTNILVFCCLSWFKNKKKSVHICGTSPSCWGEICASAAQHECSLVCLYVEWLILFGWPDSKEGLLKTGLTNKRQKVLEVTFLRTQMSLLLCVCTKDQILLMTNLFTAHLTLKHLCIHCQPSHLTAA